MLPLPLPLLLRTEMASSPKVMTEMRAKRLEQSLLGARTRSCNMGPVMVSLLDGDANGWLRVQSNSTVLGYKYFSPTALSVARGGKPQQSTPLVAAGARQTPS